MKLDEGQCRATVDQICSAVRDRQSGIKEIHVFAAMPQAFMTMLGHSFDTLRPVRLYQFDHDARRYHECLRLTGNQL